ncbi:MAG: hypothetical protein AABX73_03570 [Nanoarchaeota archaeon]
MKKEMSKLLLIVLAVFVLFNCLDNASSQTITGETVTGEVTTVTASVTIVVTGPPTLTIIYPQNNTYWNNVSLRLQVTTNGDNVWYNINEGANTTFNKTVGNYFNTSTGAKTIYVFANNSAGNVTKKNVTFSIDYSTFNVSYSKFIGQNKNSTSFAQYSHEEIQNLSGIFLEDFSYGKIKFNVPINFTDDSNINDNLLDIDEHINISSRIIYLNSTALTNFNVSATLLFYGLSETSPVIKRDGETCPSSICVQNYYTNGELSFNVTHFTTYSIEEASSASESGTTSTSTSSGSSGSSGGGGPSSLNYFSVDKEEIRISLKSGETKTEHITITNPKAIALNIKISSDALTNFINIKEAEFNLEPEEKRKIAIDFTASEAVKAGIYPGRIFIEDSSSRKEIPVIIKITSDISDSESISGSEKNKDSAAKQEQKGMWILYSLVILIVLLIFLIIIIKRNTKN